MQKSTVYYSPLPKDISFFGLKSTFPRQKFTFFSKKNILLPGDRNQGTP